MTIDVGSVRVRSLDHTGYILPVERDVANLVVETLTITDTNIKIQPRLATSWKVTDDRLWWTFELRKGVKFHDGTPFNAEALRANYQRWTSEANACAFRNVGRQLDGFEIVNESTVRIKTKVPNPWLTSDFAGFCSEISSPAAVTAHGKDIGIKQVGTGPFKVESMVPGETLTLARNPDYWGDKPLLDKVVVRSIPDPSARTAALVSRQIDISVRVPASQLPALNNDRTVKVVRQEPTADHAFIDLNAKRSPLNKVEVRQALNHAINMDEIKQIAYDGVLTPFQGVVPPTLYGTDTSLKGFAFDPNKAKELLQKAGAVGAKLQYVFAADPVLARQAEVMQAQLRTVGLELELVQLDRAASQDRWRAGQFDLFTNGYSHAAGNGWKILQLQLHTKGANNVVHNKPKFDPIIDQLGSEFDAAKQVTLLNQFNREYFEYAPWVVTALNIHIYAMGTHVRDFQTSSTGTLLGLIKAWRAE